MLEFLENTKILRNARKGTDWLYERIAKRYRLKGNTKHLLALAAILIFIVVSLVRSSVLSFLTKWISSNPKQGGVIGESVDSNVVNIEGNNNTVNINPGSEDVKHPPGSNNENCYTGWIPFTNEYWEGLNSGFEEVNGVFTLPDKRKMVDSVAFYKKPCKGPIKADLEFTSYAEKLINLDIYYGNWFRWEIGGRDLSSVKLYKNLEGCTAFRAAQEIVTDFKYLPSGEKILSESLVRSSMLVYLTDAGRLRTELNLEFFDKDGRLVTINDRFYYEFEVNLYCDSETVLDITKDFQRVGIGLMPSNVEGDELPHVRLEKFKVDKY